MAFQRTANRVKRLSDAPVVLRHKPPKLGEHTAEVIAEFGLDAKVRAAG